MRLEGLAKKLGMVVTWQPHDHKSGEQYMNEKWTYRCHSLHISPNSMHVKFLSITLKREVVLQMLQFSTPCVHLCLSCLFPFLMWDSLALAGLPLGGGVLVGNFLPQGNPLQLRCEIPQHVIGRLFYYVASCEVPA